MLTHVVLFRFRDLATAHEARQRLLSMEGRVPSLLSIEAGVDVTRSERSHELALITRHADRDGLTAYAAHPIHGEVLAWLREHMISAAAVDFVA